MNSSIQRENEIEISLKDLFVTVLGKWKIMLLAGIVLALAAVGYEYYNGSKPVEAVTYESIIEEYELTASEIATASDYAERYRVLDDSLNSLSDYLQNGAIMKLQASSVVQYKTAYLVETDLNELNDLITAALVLTTDDYEHIRQILGFDENIYDIQSLVRFYTNVIGGPDTPDTSGETDNTVDSVAGSMLDSLLRAASEANYKSVLTTTIFADTVEQAESMSDVADAALSVYLSKLTEAGAFINITKIDSSYSDEWNSAVDYSQKTYREQFDTQSKTLVEFTKNYVAALSEGQKKLFSYLAYENNSSGEEASVAVDISKKNIVLGFDGGVVLMALWIICVYLFSDTLKTADDVQLISQTAVLGTYKRKTAVDGSSTAILAARISALLDKNHVDRAFINTQGSSKADQLVASLAAELNKQGKQLFYGNAVEDADGYAAMHNSGIAIALINLKTTSRQSLKDFITVCQEAEVPMVGEIVVEDKLSLRI